MYKNENKCHLLLIVVENKNDKYEAALLKDLVLDWLESVSHLGPVGEIEPTDHWIWGRAKGILYSVLCCGSSSSS